MPSLFISTYRNRISGYLEHTIKQLQLAQPSATPTPLAEAMAYGLLNGGKRIRPLLCYAAALAVSEVNEASDSFAASVECIHAYSLIHDDLPAMDDDELRRGQPTCHIAFDEATAILAGDGLQSLAFELISSSAATPETALEACQLLAKAAGPSGMVLGQAIDLASVDSELSLEQLALMHNRKTGALIEASVVLGALSAGANEEQKSSLKHFAQDMGLAFQVQDDIIDVTSDTQTLGKAQGADASLNKPTYVSLLGLDGAKQKANELLASSLQHLAKFGSKAEHLEELARLIVSRNN